MRIFWSLTVVQLEGLDTYFLRDLLFESRYGQNSTETIVYLQLYLRVTKIKKKHDWNGPFFTMTT